MFISLLLKNGLVQASSILISCPLFGARRSEVAIRFFTGLELSFPDLSGAIKIVPGVPSDPLAAFRASPVCSAIEYEAGRMCLLLQTSNIGRDSPCGFVTRETLVLLSTNHVQYC